MGYRRTIDLHAGARHEQFEAEILVHFDAAWNFAKWLTGDRELAEDAVQEACLKALRAFGSRTGPSAKAWFMAIVRNASMDAMRVQKRRKAHDSFDEEALRTFARHESGAGVAALDGRGPLIQAQAAFLFFGSVTFKARCR